MHIEVSEPVGIPPDSKRRFSDRECLAWGRANPELNVERTAEREIEIAAAASLESSHREVNGGRHLSESAERGGRGQGFVATVRFMPPDGSARSPDAAWVSSEALAKLIRREEQSFPYLVSDFVVEVRSPRNSLKTKMERWIASGVRLGWLVDGDHETDYIEPKRTGRRAAPDSETGQRKAGKGFGLNLRPIWQGLR